MSDSTKLGRLKHANALVVVAITELEKGRPIDSDWHAQEARVALLEALLAKPEAT